MDEAEDHMSQMFHCIPASTLQQNDLKNNLQAVACCVNGVWNLERPKSTGTIYQGAFNEIRQ